MIKKIFIPIFILAFISFNPLQAQEPFLGEVKLFGGNFAPRGWAFCEGQLLPISSHDALFSILGTTYGGDGRTTFGLPDLRGREAIGAGTGPGLTPIRDGEKGGSEKITITQSQTPSNQMNVPAYKMKPDKATDELKPGNKSLLTVGNTPGSNVKTSSTGNGQGVNSRSPALGMRYIIALTGVYPSRS